MDVEYDLEAMRIGLLGFSRSEPCWDAGTLVSAQSGASPAMPCQPGHACLGRSILGHVLGQAMPRHARPCCAS